MNIINLDENVVRALDFFSKNQPPKLDLKKLNFPFVIGSGNAYNTGMILFSRQAAVFADESNFRPLIESHNPMIKKGIIKDAVIISASGEKDSVREIELAKKHRLKTTLLTCTAGSSATKIADRTLVYRKIAEPYTYNVSTYLGMILSSTMEDSKKILSFLSRIRMPKNFNTYRNYAFILPDSFVNICPMLDIKKSELFGSYVSIRAFSRGHARHAKFIHRSEKELVISINGKNKFFGHPKHRWDLKLPNASNFATVLCLAYFLIGKIQAAKLPYFKKNIEAYCRDYGPLAYGKNEKFDLIVLGN